MTFFPRVTAGTLQWGKAIFLPYSKSFNTVTKCRALAKPEEENRGQTVSCFLVRLGRKESKKGYGSEKKKSAEFPGPRVTGSPAETNSQRWNQ